MSVQQRNNLDTLNNSENYFVLKKYGDLAIGQLYQVLKYEVKKHPQYGKKLQLTMKLGGTAFGELDTLEPEIFIYYIAASYAEPKKVAALDSLLKTKNSKTFLTLTKVSCVTFVFI